MKEFGRKNNHGLTLVELMISLAIMAILLAIAAPSLQNVRARSNIKEGTDKVLQAFHTAKNTARITNLKVELSLTTDGSGDPVVTFQFPSGANTLENGLTLPDIELPEDMTVSADTTVFNFNSMGMINATDPITLTSTINSTHTSTVTIENDFGYVSAVINP